MFTNVISPTSFYLLGSVLYLGFYPVLRFLLEKTNSKFSDYSTGRKYYILSNIMKSWVLSVLAVVFTKNVLNGTVDIIHCTNWKPRRTFFLQMSALYTITDTMSLLVNREKMMLSTIVHHACVGLSYIYINTLDFAEEGIYKGLIMYGGFSSLAFLVNFYLGSRFLIESEKNKKKLQKLSGVSYVISCAGNWSWQLFYLIKLLVHYYSNPKKVQLNTVIGLIFYSTVLKYWIQDDLILMRHLLT